MYQQVESNKLGRMTGSARRLGSAKGELHWLRGQKLVACTSAVGTVDTLRVLQKRLQNFCEGGN